MTDATRVATSAAAAHATSVTPSEGHTYADRPVRIALQLQPQHADYPAIRRTVAKAETIGVDIVFTWDHFYPLHGDADGRHFECWSMLAAWAEATESVELGALVTCNSYRNPDLLADMARTVDHISDGRLILGIGSGWFERDYDSYGYEFGTAGGRLDALGKSLPRIKKRLEVLNPSPTRRLPILIGGGGERKTLRLVATYADIWHGFGTAETVAHKHEVLDAWCDKVGRDPAGIERSAAVPGKEVAEGAPALYDVGTRLFTVSVSGPEHDLGPIREAVAWRDQVNA